MRYLTLLWILLVCKAHGECRWDHPLSLAELVNIALENNPETKIAWWNATKASAAVGNAKSGYYPTVDLAGGIENGRTFKYVKGPDTSYTVVGIDLILSVMLYDFGERDAEVEATKYALEKAGWEVNGAVQRVILEVLEGSYAMLHAQECLSLTAISCTEALLLHEAAKDLQQAGFISISDVYATESALSLMKIAVLEKENGLQFQKGKLAQALGLPAECPFQIAPLEPLFAFPRQKVEELMELAKQYRPDILAKQNEIWEVKLRQKQVQAEYCPKLYLNAAGGANYAFHDKAHGGQYKVSLNFDVPLFDGFSQSYRNQIMRSGVEISLEEMRQLELEASLEIFKFSLMVEAAQEMMIHAENNLKNAIKAYAGIFEMYKAGKERLAEVSMVRQDLASARMLYSEIKTKALSGAAHLAFATGTLCY